jgi:hypothetical protein
LNRVSRMPAPAAAADDGPVAKRHDTRGEEQLNIPLVIEAVSIRNLGLSGVGKRQASIYRGLYHQIDMNRSGLRSKGLNVDHDI